MNFKNFYMLEKRIKKLPPGFTDADIGDMDKFLVRDDSIKPSYVKEEISDAETHDVDIDELIKQRLNPQSKGIDIAKKPEKLLHPKTILDKNKNVINPDVLKQMIMTRPKSLISQNGKMKKSGGEEISFYKTTLPAYMGLYVDEATGEFKSVKTCPAAGVCTAVCYASKGNFIMFKDSVLNAARTINFIMNDPDGYKNRMVSDLNKLVSKGKVIVLRWHDSGDVVSEKYLMLMFEIAKETPKVFHYAYTKQVPLIRSFENNKPENFKFVFSFGGDYDDMINLNKDVHAKVVPSKLFNDLDKEKVRDEKGNILAITFSSESIQKLKERVAKEFNLDISTVITYDEMVKMPKGETKKWNVLIWKGHGDDAATRNDVTGNYLLFH